MVKYIYADDLTAFPALQSGMFQDRRRQFLDRQKWELKVNAAGEERDEYDALNPLYVIATDCAGQHAGSMRFLPTVGRTMVNEHFTHLLDGVKITSPLIWECTRFCISPGVSGAGRVAAKLMLAGCEMGLRFGLHSSVGVFDARMVRIYRRLGWSPEMIGSSGVGRDQISAGLWEYSPEMRLALCAKAGVSPRAPARWFESSFHAQPAVQKAAA